MPDVLDGFERHDHLEGAVARNAFGIPDDEFDAIDGMMSARKRDGFIRNIHPSDRSCTAALEDDRAVPRATGDVEDRLARYEARRELVSGHMLANDMGPRVHLRK